MLGMSPWVMTPTRLPKTKTSPSKPSKAPQTAEQQKQNSQAQRASSQQATASTTVSKPKGPSKALIRDLWGHHAWAPSHQAPGRPARAHTRPAIQPHQWTHEPAHCQGTSAGRSPSATPRVNGTPRGQGRRGACKVSQTHAASQAEQPSQSRQPSAQPLQRL
jgi:hypothetical protein